MALHNDSDTNNYDPSWHDPYLELGKAFVEAVRKMHAETNYQCTEYSHVFTHPSGCQCGYWTFDTKDTTSGKT